MVGWLLLVRSKRQNRILFCVNVCALFFLFIIVKKGTYWNAAILIITIIGIVSWSLDRIHVTEVALGSIFVFDDFQRFNETLLQQSVQAVHLINLQRKHGQECVPCQWWSCPRPWPPSLDCRDGTTSYLDDRMPCAKRQSRRDWRRWRTWPSRHQTRGRNPMRCRFAIDPENKSLLQAAACLRDRSISITIKIKRINQ